MQTFNKQCEWVVYIDICNGLYKSVFCSPLYKGRHKDAYAAGAIKCLNIPNQGTSLREQHLLADNEGTGLHKTYEDFMWLSKQTVVASMKLTVQSTQHDYGWMN